MFSDSAPQNIIIVDAGATECAAVVASIDPKYKQSMKPLMTSIEIKGVAADRGLSSKAIDSRLAAIMAARFTEQNPGVSVPPGRSYNRLLGEAKRVKEVLSANNEFLTGVEDLVNEHSFSTTVTRAELEAACADMPYAVEKVVHEALAMAGMTLNDISLVIPIGGNSRVPFVMDALRRTAGAAKVSQTLNAEEAAVKGATLYAAALHATFRLKQFRFKDVVPTGLEMSYAATEPKTLQIYPAGRSQLESHKGVSLRGLDNVDFTFSQLPGGLPLYRMHVSGFEEAVAKVENVKDSKMKLWIDIDRNGIFKIQPPVALIEAEKMVVPTEKPAASTEKMATSTEKPASSTEKTTTSTEQTATSTETPVPTSTPSATPKEPVPVRVTETGTLKHTIEALQKDLAEDVKKKCRQEIAEYRERIALSEQRSRAHNDVESAYYTLRGEMSDKSFSRWFTADELAALAKLVDLAAPLIDEDKPETSITVFTDLLAKIEAAQKAPLLRKSEAQKRPDAVRDVKKAIAEAHAYANNTLHVFEPEQRAQSNAELEGLMRDADEFDKDLEAKLQEQAGLADNADPVFKCADISARAELLGLTMKMLKRRPAPKPAPTPTSTPTPTPGPTPTSATGAQDKPEVSPEATHDTAPKEHSDL